MLNSGLEFDKIFNFYISGSTRLQDFRAGLESENEISDLDDQLKKLSTAQDAEEDDSFGTVVKFSFFKKAAKIWSYLPLDMTFT